MLNIYKRGLDIQRRSRITKETTLFEKSNYPRVNRLNENKGHEHPSIGPIVVTGVVTVPLKGR